MKLVIEMDENEYKEILKDRHINHLRIIKAIKNGTPLPKGHGRLIDADETIRTICGKSCGCEPEECGREVPCYSVTRINSSPTIIEADTTRDCKTCGHSNDGKCAFTEECHECMWVNKYIEADKEGEQE